jgi:hypothetical protein
VRVLPTYRRRRAGRFRRAAVWLLVAALLFELPSGAAVAMRMWWDYGPMQAAEVPCPEHGGAAGHNSGHATHDHQQCLLCNVGLGTGTLPVVALLPTPVVEPVASISTPQPPAVRKDIRAAAPRGPPRLA